MAQTLTEIDYETVIDNEDVVNEFLLFKNTLRSETAVYISVRQTRPCETHQLGEA